MAESSSTTQTSDTTSVKTLKVKTESMAESQNKDNFRQCNICFDDTKPDMLVNTPCGHIFCCECFFEWMKQNYTCPCCRTLLIKREESQLATLRVNRAEIAVQEEHLSELQDDVSNLRRLQRIHKRRVKKLETSNEEQLKRQIRLRSMIARTRNVRDNVVNQIQDIIPRNKLQRFTTSFYTKLVSGECENALKEAKKLIKRAALHEWKQRNSKVMNELCEKCKTGRSDAYLDKCMDELLENTSGIKRSSNDVYTSTESESSDNEEEKTSEDATTNQQSAARGRARRRMRIPSRDERIAHQQTTLRQSAQVLLQGAIREAMDISGIEIPDETMTEMQELVTILNNYRSPSPATPETVVSDPEEQAVSEPGEQVVSESEEQVVSSYAQQYYEGESEEQVVSESEAQAIVPIPSFTFTMPDTGEPIEFSWNPPQQNEGLFVFGANENREHNGDNNNNE